MEIQRQAEQYALSSPMYHQASIPDEDLRDMLAGPRITAGYLNTREGIARTNPAGDLNMSPAKMDQKALTTAPKPPKLPPLPKPESQPGVPKIQQQVQQNVASRRIVADDDPNKRGGGGGGYFSNEPGGMFGPAKPGGGVDWGHYFSGEPGGMFGPAATPASPATPAADKGPAGGAVPSAAGATPTTPGGIQGPHPAGTAGAPATPQGMQPGGDWAHSLNTSPLAAGEHTVAPGETVGDIQGRAGGGAVTGINGDLIHPGDKYTVGPGGTSGTTAPATSHAPVQGPGLPGNPGGPPAASIGNTNGGNSIDYKSMYQSPTAPKTSSYHIARDAHGNSYFDDSKGYRYFLAQGGDPAGDNPDLAEAHRRENQPAATPGPTKDLANAGGPTKDTVTQGQPGQPGRDLKAPAKGAAPAGGPKEAAPAAAAAAPGVKMTTDSVPPVGGAAPAGGDYTVNKGDTLSGIAQSHGLGGNYQAIVDANPGAMASGTDIKSNPNMIHPGDVFKMPGGAPAGPAAVMPPAPTSETVAPGEAPVPGFVPAGGRAPMPGGMFVPPKAASRQGITCQGSSHYPLAQHQKVEGLYRCAGCGQWGPVTVLSKMVEHRLIQADDRTPSAPTPMAGEANSAMPAIAPLTGTGAPGVPSATDALTQAAGSPMLPTLRQV